MDYSFISELFFLVNLNTILNEDAFYHQMIHFKLQKKNSITDQLKRNLDLKIPKIDLFLELVHLV